MVKVIFLTYAGGSSLGCFGWKKYMDDTYEFVVIDLPGHGKRRELGFMDSFCDVIEDIYEQIKVHTGDEYILLGHSLGAIIIYCIYERICMDNIHKPKTMIFSGSDIPERAKKTYIEWYMDKVVWETKLKEFGLVDSSFLTCSNIGRKVMEIIDNDMKLIFTYEPQDIFIETDVIVMYSDDLDKKKVMDWKNRVGGKFGIKYFPGGHLFIAKNPESVFVFLNELVKNGYISD